MFMALMMVATLMGAAVLLLVLYNEDHIITETVALRVRDNMGKKTPKQRGYLAWFSPTSPPVVPTDPNQVAFENVLVLEQYPLFPVRVTGPWISPGETVSALVVKNPDGNPVDIRIAV